jgi:hypothetical protein
MAFNRQIFSVLARRKSAVLLPSQAGGTTASHQPWYRRALSARVCPVTQVDNERAFGGLSGRVRAGAGKINTKLGRVPMEQVCPSKTRDWNRLLNCKEPIATGWKTPDIVFRVFRCFRCSCWATRRCCASRATGAPRAAARIPW